MLSSSDTILNDQNGVPSAAGLRGWSERLSPAPAPAPKKTQPSIFSKWLRPKISPAMAIASSPQLWVDRYCDRQLGFINGTIELPERKKNKDGTYKVCVIGPWWYPDQSKKPVVVRFGQNNILDRMRSENGYVYLYLDNVEDFREFVEFFRANWFKDPEVCNNVLRLHKATFGKNRRQV